MLLCLAFSILSCVVYWLLMYLLAGPQVTSTMWCWGGLPAAGWEKQHNSIDLCSRTGEYYPYGFDWKLPRIWKTNLVVEIWRKQCSVSQQICVPVPTQCTIIWASFFCRPPFGPFRSSPATSWAAPRTNKWQLLFCKGSSMCFRDAFQAMCSSFTVLSACLFPPAILSTVLLGRV